MGCCDTGQLNKPQLVPKYCIIEGEREGGWPAGGLAGWRADLLILYYCNSGV